MIPGSLSGRRDFFIPILLGVLVFLLAARTPIDSDLWWHLAAGRQTWLSGAPMVVDVFSFLKASQTWINHSWLSQWILYGLYQVGGWGALSAWVGVLAVASMGLIYVQMRGPAIFRAFLVVLAVTVSAVVWSPRPQMISFALFALLSWVLYRFKWERKNSLWLIPPIFFLWSNLHGGWSLGYMLLGVFLAGEAVNHLLKNDSPFMLKWRELSSVFAWGLASLPLLAINPNGLSIFKIPFQTVQVQVLQQFIQEWASPDFHEFYQQPYLWLLMAVLTAAGLSGRKMDSGDLLAVIWFGALGLVARRNFGPFALVATPVLARYLWTAYRSWREPVSIASGGWGPVPDEAPRERKRPRWQRILNLALVGGFFFVGLVKCWAVSSPLIIQSAMAGSFPVRAVDWLNQNHASGNILNEYNWGGYLLWSAPNLRVAVDGRTDLYGDAILSDWMQILQADQDWDTKLQTWRVDWVLVSPERPLVRALIASGWLVEKRDPFSVLLKNPAQP